MFKAGLQNFTTIINPVTQQSEVSDIPARCIPNFTIERP